MYEDKLDGRITAEFFDEKSSELRNTRDSLFRQIKDHQDAEQSYFEEGSKLLELTQRAYELFEKQDARERRQFLGYLLSNCIWKEGELSATFRQPFDLIAEMSQASKAENIPDEVFPAYASIQG